MGSLQSNNYMNTLPQGFFGVFPLNGNSNSSNALGLNYGATPATDNSYAPSLLQPQYGQNKTYGGGYTPNPASSPDFIKGFMMASRLMGMGLQQMKGQHPRPYGNPTTQNDPYQMLKPQVGSYWNTPNYGQSDYKTGNCDANDNTLGTTQGNPNNFLGISLPDNVNALILVILSSIGIGE
jgi:hypothetical protein